VSPAVVAQGPTWYAYEVAEHWRLARETWEIEERGLAPMTLIGTLPRTDQVILAEAYRTGCEVVLTNDLKWVKPKHAKTIAGLGMAAHTPESLVTYLRPWLGLWV